MTQTLESLIKEADRAFLGNLVATQYHMEIPTARPSELLAHYLMAEMRDLYDLDSSDCQNLRRIVSGLDMASDRLAAVAEYLRVLQKASLA